MSGYVVYWRGDSPDEEIGWRITGAALPAGAVPAIVCDGLETLTLHGHGETEFGRRLASVQAEAEAELAEY